MITIILAEKRHYNDFGWLKTYWLFSFSDDYDPKNVRFGGLRVFNDDIVAPGTGFDTHPHREMEIVTIVLSGEITHRDSMGHEAVIRSGEVQRMTAGTGVTHSEYNRGNEPVHFYQIWIHPEKQGLSPGYEQKGFAGQSRKNRLLQVVSGRAPAVGITLHADVNIYLADLAPGKSLSLHTGKDRLAFLYFTEGGAAVNGEAVEKNDQVRIQGADHATVSAHDTTTFIHIDLPAAEK